MRNRGIITNKKTQQANNWVHIEERKLIELLTGSEGAVGSLSSTLLPVVYNAKVLIIGGSHLAIHYLGNEAEKNCNQE